MPKQKSENSKRKLIRLFAEALRETNPQLLHSRVESVLGAGYLTIILSDVDLNNWIEKIELIKKSFYSLYLQHSELTERFSETEMDGFRELWKFVRISSELMSLPFFQNLYAQTTQPIQSSTEPSKVELVRKEIEARLKRHHYLWSNITPNVLINATREELELVLGKDKGFLSPGEKLILLQIHRQYC